MAHNLCGYQLYYSNLNSDVYLDLYSEPNVIGVVRRATSRKYSALENYECSPIHYNSISNVISGSTPSSTSTPCGTTPENSDPPDKPYKRPRGQKPRSNQATDKAKEPREQLMIAEIHNQCDQCDQRSDSDPDHEEEIIYYC